MWDFASLLMWDFFMFLWFICKHHFKDSKLSLDEYYMIFDDFFQFCCCFYGKIRLKYTMSAQKGKKTEDSVDFGILIQAIRDVKMNKKAAKPTARAYKIPKTSFYRYLEKVNAKYTDISRVDDVELMNCLRGITARGTKTVIIFVLLSIFSKF